MIDFTIFQDAQIWPNFTNSHNILPSQPMNLESKSYPYNKYKQSNHHKKYQANTNK